MKAYEQALIELQYPQVTYHAQGGYGEPITAIATIAGTVGQIAGSIFGMNRQNKQAQATLEAQSQMARDQNLIQGQIAAQQAATSAQHAANMPLYLLVGGGVVLSLGVVVMKRKK
jgi:hypothetical protein